jgi:hypothetical protein
VCSSDLNLVNYPIDARLTAMAARLGAVYTRYADDVTISFADHGEGETVRPRPASSSAAASWQSVPISGRLHFMQRFARQTFEKAGYMLHRRKKTSVRRRHHRQVVCGLVVNDRVNLPRETRRWLRAVEHRMRLQGEAQTAPIGSLDYVRRKEPTLTQSQWNGWLAFCSMIARQTEGE